MDHEWIIEVADHAGAALSGATVVLVESSTLAAADWPFTAAAATHAETSSGKYEASAPITPVAGDWTLIVRATGKSPVVQPLKMKARAAGEMITSTSPRTAATITFSTEVRVAGTAKVRRALFKVKMFPSSEIISISGTEYESKGTQFRIFATNHWSSLRRANAIHLAMATSSTRLVSKAMTDFAEVGKSGHIYELHDTVDATKSVGLYVQRDQKIFRVDRDATGKFTVLGPEL
jgi:hypothetical protein